MSRKIDISEATEVEKRQREVQLLVNIVEPDPEYQPLFISDAACFYDVSGKHESEIEESLKHYFKGDLPAPLRTPIWRFVEVVKQRYPGWPDDWPPEH